MNRLHLATVLSWAGQEGLKGRKRLQKVAFFLQEAGCPLDCPFILHHFGPYSREVADTCDDMVAAGLVVEHSGAQSGGATQYSYVLKPETLCLLEKSPDPTMAPFSKLGARLINEDLWSLELGSTILFFYRQLNDWNVAFQRACEYKRVPIEHERSTAALTFAQQLSTSIPC